LAIPEDGCRNDRTQERDDGPGAHRPPLASRSLGVTCLLGLLESGLDHRRVGTDPPEQKSDFPLEESKLALEVLQSPGDQQKQDEHPHRFHDNAPVSSRGLRPNL
jgi:hypothetical protein